MGALLDRIEGPEDLRRLDVPELEVLAEEIRAEIVRVVDRNGGHLGSNLGVVELTLALHRTFDFRKDRLVWDVSHQTYAHKLVTGRRGRFEGLRQFGGLSGFTCRLESPYDLFDIGHAGTAVSTALGLAVADAIRGRDALSVAVVGDASMGCGPTFEALNHAGGRKGRLLVVLNDNRMSISRTVGALSQYLNRMRTQPLYRDIKKEIREILGRIPILGRSVEGALEHLWERLRHTIVPGLIFQELGFRYYGPIDGHDLRLLLRTFENLRGEPGPLLVHVLTEKGRGYAPAVADPARFHSSRRFLSENGDGPHAHPSYTSTFQDAMLEIGREDPDVVAVTSAMLEGTGLAPFAEAFPDRLFDVGIAEEHGATFAGALAAGGVKPVFAVYSTFCQRAFDQVAHDVALQEAPTVFALDRAGLVEDGPTHHGAFDIAYLRVIPGMVVMAPRDGRELRAMLRFALGLRRPVAIRYPKAPLPEGLPEAHAPIDLGRMETLREGQDVALLAYGSMVETAWRAAKILEGRGIDAAVFNARFAKPIARADLVRIARRHPTIVTLEEHAAIGGFGAAILETLNDADPGSARVLRITLPDLFVTFGSRADLLASLRLDADGVAESVESFLRAAAPAPMPVPAPAPL